MLQNPAPPRIHVLAKPSGATCNLACSYCFFLDKELLYPDSKFRMDEETLEDRLRELALGADPPLHTVVLDFEGVNFIDSQGSAKMAELLELTTNYEIDLRLTRVKPHVKNLLQRDGVIDNLGESHIYGNVYEAAADKIP
jgi:anti-anti-sigma factor